MTLLVVLAVVVALAEVTGAVCSISVARSQRAMLAVRKREENVPSCLVIARIDDPTGTFDKKGEASR